MEPLLKEAAPRLNLVFPLVTVVEPRVVTFLPLEMDELPMAILVLSLLMTEPPTDTAVFPSVILVLPIVEEMAVFQTWLKRWISGFTRRHASYTHAAHPALQALGGTVTMLLQSRVDQSAKRG